MKTKKSFLQEFKSMLFNYKVIYIFLAYVIISSLLIALIGYRPVKTFYKASDYNYTEEIDKLKEQYYGMKYGDIEKDINEKIYDIRGGGMFADISVFERLAKINTELQLEVSKEDYDQEKVDKLLKEAEIAKQEQEKELERVKAGLSEEDQRKVNVLEGVLLSVRDQIHDSKVTSIQDKRLEDIALVDESDTFYNIKKEGLLLGFGGYFNENSHFIAWMNAFVLEIFLGIISYSYIRKRKNDSIKNGDIEAYKEDKKNILLSFITISLIMAVLMLIRHFAIVNIKYPGEIVNLKLKQFIDYYTGNATIKTQLIVTIVLSIVYYIARPVIYAKRSEVISHKKSMMYFIILNLLMYGAYYFAAKNVFVSITGPGFLADPIINIVILIIFIAVAASSYRSFILGKGFFERRKAEKLTENKENKK